MKHTAVVIGLDIAKGNQTTFVCSIFFKNLNFDLAVAHAFSCL
ncbi:MAG: hypothetical protein ACOY4D_06690 [Pseudomonadota bacterium]